MKSDIVKGNSVVFDGGRRFSPEQFGLEKGKIYYVQGVDIVPMQTLLPREYIEAGYIPDSYKPHMIKGITTTNHDTMGSDRLLHIGERTFSAMLFRLATKEEVRLHANLLL